jgi:creatinine amidohydrolase
MSAPAKGRTASRNIGDLAFPEVGSAIHATSILCLPMGSMEQHGPHLPLNTDTVLAEAFTGRLVERWGEAFDLWRLPAIPIGLSREHDWAAGTMSLSVGGMTALLRDLVREMVRAVPARNLLIVNGHGGNRGILEALGRELHGDFGVNLVTLHLGAMMSPVPEAGLPEIHAGKDETSVMLALAPDLVRPERLGELVASPDGHAIRATVLDPATSWPWSSGDPRIASAGVIGDAVSASAGHGDAVVSRMVEAAGAVLQRLRDNHTAR